MPFSWNAGRIERNIETLDRDTDRAIKAITEFQASRGEAQMKTDAPWTDRTGAARTGLHTATHNPPGSYQIIFAHSVPYGIWLEVANSGDYQVIMPTVRLIGRDTMAQFDNLFGRKV